MIKYIFRDDEPIRIKAAGKADPQVFGEALDKIAKKHNGALTPEAVVEEAASKRHPLHAHFEWDDAIAAQAHRLDQARSIIRIVRVAEPDNEENPEPRAFLSVNGKDGTAYRTLEDVRGSAEFQEAILSQADRDLEAFQRRYREMGDICAFVASARDAIARRKSKIENRVGENA